MSDRKDDIADKIAHAPLNTLRSKIGLVARLTWPAIMAQMSMIVCEYIDAAMVGSLGAEPAAGIGLVSTTTWLFWGLGVAAATGFAVQVAHQIGADNNRDARSTLRQAIIVIACWGLILGLAGVALSGPLPHWLGGNEAVCVDSTAYFFWFAISLPFMLLTNMSAAMLRCSGNMLLPGIVNVAMCVMDVIFNFFLIYQTRTVTILGSEIIMPGAGWGVEGAAIGSGLAFSVGGVIMFTHLLRRSPRLRGAFREAARPFRLSGTTLRRAAVISWPMALERIVMCGAQILITAIVAPLGTAAIAANSFAITAESLCYTPGFGVGDAGTTLVGQSLGAGRKPLAFSFARICLVAGMGIMAVLGVVMWIFAPEMMALFTPDETVRALGTMALRTEAWAEPMFGAAIVCYCICVGAGYTKIPAMVNFGSIWIVRLTLSAILAPKLGLFGVWLAMCIELCVRGLVFLFIFVRRSWINKAKVLSREQELADDSAPEETPLVM